MKEHFCPVEKSMITYQGKCNWCGEREALAQTQEPVAVVDVHEFYDNCANFSLLQKLPKGKHTLYTTPPQRTWVGLTDEDICMFSMWLDDKSDVAVFTAIEARLKELNT